VKTHKGRVVEEKTQSLKKPGSSKSIRRRMPVKLILLGTENSGKSAIAKQMKITYQKDGYTPDERKNMLPQIHAYILGNIKDILQGIVKLNLSLSPESLKVATHISSIPKTQTWTSELVVMLKTLLLDTVVSKFLSKCAELQLYDNFSRYVININHAVHNSTQYHSHKQHTMLHYTQYTTRNTSKV
jgi:GTPase SAR1 family protein